MICDKCPQEAKYKIDYIGTDREDPGTKSLCPIHFAAFCSFVSYSLTELLAGTGEV